MGIFSSSSIQKDITGIGTDKILSKLTGFTSNENEILYYNKDSFFSVQNIATSETLSTRILSLEPTCICTTKNGSFIIGFKNGVISEFDIDLNLIKTFLIPGSFRAHNGEVTHVVCSSKCYLMSLGLDKTMSFWDDNGIRLSSITSTGTFTAICCSDLYMWLADSNHRMHVIDLGERKVYKVFNTQDTVIAMSPFGNGKACLASLKNGSIIIISTYSVMSSFIFNNRPPVISIFPLKLDINSGIFSYFAMDSNGSMTIRTFEQVIKELGTAYPFFSINKDNILVIVNEKIQKFSIKALEADSVKRIPKELPRTNVFEFLLKDQDS